MSKKKEEQKEQMKKSEEGLRKETNIQIEEVQRVPIRLI